MSRQRRASWWISPPQAIPKHPIRDAAILYGAFGVALVLIAWAAGTSVSRAIVLAIGFFAVALGWSVLNWRRHKRDVQLEEFDT